MQGAIIVLRASPAKQRVGCEAEKYRINYVPVATKISFDSAQDDITLSRVEVLSILYMDLIGNLS